MYEFDDTGFRVIGYNVPISFYDPDRTLQQTIYLRDDNALSLGDVIIVRPESGGDGGGKIDGVVWMKAHALDGEMHSGTLGNAQAPQFLLKDGTRDLEGNLLVQEDVEIQFRDTDLAIWSSTDGQLDLKADVELQVVAPTIDLQGDVTITGTLSGIGLDDLDDTDLADPDADRIVFWDDSDGAYEWLVPNTGLEIDGNNLNCTVSALTEEQVEDYVGGMVTGNTETHITVTYQDGDGTLDFVVDPSGIGLDDLANTTLADPDADRIVFWDDSDGAYEWLVPNTGLEIDGNNLNCTVSALTEEQVEDYVGGMVTGNTETHITVTYQDGDGTLDFVVDPSGIGLDDLANTTLADPDADRIVFWDDSDGAYEWLVPNVGLDITGNDLDVDVTDFLGNGMGETLNNLFCYELRQSDDGGAALTADAAGDLSMAGDLSIASGKGLIHADSVADGKVLVANGTRYVPGEITDILGHGYTLNFCQAFDGTPYSIAGDNVVFSATVYEDCTILYWRICVYPRSPNGATNYWTIVLRKHDIVTGTYTTLGSFTTATMTDDDWNIEETDISAAISTSGDEWRLEVRAFQNNSPGNLGLCGPAVFVEH